MTEQLTGLRVFIATPGGLEQERRAFREAVEEINLEAYDRGLAFIPIGWEFAPAGLGRPQEQINDEVRRCDYMVLVLHDRWGTPPAVNGEYSSGTEEEYNVARECAADVGKPMRDIAVLFKGVDPRQLSDPGEQLKKVLSFKDALERERALMFKTFDTVEEFSRELRVRFLKWLRDLESGAGEKAVTPPPPDTPPEADKTTDDETGAEESVLERAAKLADEGRLTQAESLYASAVVGRTDPEAMTKYARFLRRTGRLDLADTMSQRLYEVAHDLGDTKAMIEALSNRAIIYRKKGANDQSIAELEKAVEIARAAGPDERGDLAFLLDNLGLTLRKQGRFREAVRHHLEALKIKRDLDDQKSLAKTLNHAGALLRQSGSIEEAREMTEEAIRVFSEMEYQRGEAEARANLGEVLLLVGNLDAAEEEFEKSLELNKRLNSPEGAGMNLWQLGRLAFERGDLEEAERRAVEAFGPAGEERRSRPEATAAPMQLLGKIHIARDNFNEAIEELEYAAQVYERNKHILGGAWSTADLAVAYAKAGRSKEAIAALQRAEELGGALAHNEFQAALQTARKAVKAAQPAPGS